jgi:phosphohistidine swiveling domain-containing protein/Fe2+ or Zn2+ uptake regulation protein
MRLSKTSKKILKILFDRPDHPYYINELVRLTSLYPNAVYRSLLTLEKQKIIKPHVQGRLKFYQLNDKYKHFNALKNIISKSTLVQSKPEMNWVKILNRQTSHSFTSALCEANVTKLKEIYGISVPSFWLNDITHGVYYSKKELHNLGKAVADLIDSNKNFAKNDIRKCKETCDKLVEVSKEVFSIDLIRLANNDLVKLLNKFYKHYLAVFPFVTVPHGIERHFEEKIREKTEDKRILELLLSPVALSDQERDDALKIASHVKSNGFDSKAKKLIEKHTTNYCWLPLWSIFHKPLSQEYFTQEIKNMVENLEDPEEELKRIHDQETSANRKLEKAFEKIKASRSLKEQVRFLQEYIYLRVYRKNSICQAHYYHLPLLHEAGSRLKLTKDEVKLLSHKEIVMGLKSELSIREIMKIVDDRKKGWAILMLNGKMKTIIGGDKIIEVIERYNIVSPATSLKRVIKGNPACQGKITGKVKIISKLSELSKVEKGDVLVTKMTTPDYMIAIHKAVAIVTDEGGVTCHAAIVSREFNIPCIVATRNATQVLSDNDLVEVDAYKGEVQILEPIDFPEDIEKINAKTIYKGKVKGTARIITDSSDFDKIQVGDILVSAQTTPEFLSALYRVKGFIVDENSLTSHAMFCGKSLKIPSVMGAQFARYAIKDGEQIELDATSGLVTRLKK